MVDKWSYVSTKVDDSIVNGVLIVVERLTEMVDLL